MIRALPAPAADRRRARLRERPGLGTGHQNVIDRAAGEVARDIGRAERAGEQPCRRIDAKDDRETVIVAIAPPGPHSPSQRPLVGAQSSPGSVPTRSTRPGAWMLKSPATIRLRPALSTLPDRLQTGRCRPSTSATNTTPAHAPRIPRHRRPGQRRLAAAHRHPRMAALGPVIAGVNMSPTSRFENAVGTNLHDAALSGRRSAFQTSTRSFMR